MKAANSPLFYPEFLQHSPDLGGIKGAGQVPELVRHKSRHASPQFEKENQQNRPEPGRYQMIHKDKRPP